MLVCCPWGNIQLENWQPLNKVVHAMLVEQAEKIQMHPESDVEQKNICFDSTDSSDWVVQQ